MGWRRSLPVERPVGPLIGHKLAYPMLSADGRSAGFGGLWSSAQPVYRARDTAACFWNPRHSPPHRRCGCGFYCHDSLDAARAMACEERYRSTVILDVRVSGRFIRHEKGFRYSDQQVLAVHLNPCLCGRPASVLVDSGSGVTGWLRLQPSCLVCRGPKETLSLARFGALLGEPAVDVTGTFPVDGARWGGDPDRPADGDDRSGSSLSVLRAEITLLQARVDSLEAQLSRLV
jgi:hypothetical protein